MNTNRRDPLKQIIPGPPAVELHNVGVLRDNRWILKNVTWQVNPGTLAAILGPNGSGKSTLARLIATHWWPTTGTCSVLGYRFGNANLPELRKQIRMVQPAGPYDAEGSLTAHQTVLTGFFGTIGLYDSVTPQMKRRASALLNLVGLSKVAPNPYPSLSSGEKVRTLIARAMANAPRLLILDEPTAGLDLRAREQVLATVDLLMKTPNPPTVLLITHHVEELPPTTDQVLLLHRNKPAARGTMRQVLTPNILSKVYGVRVTVGIKSGRYYPQVQPSAWKQLLKFRKP